MWNIVEKIQGGMHELLKNSGGPFIVILPDLKEAPLNSQQFLGDCSQRPARWAFTGRRCPHNGKGEDFLTGQPNFFTETAVTPERKVEKSFPRSEINRHDKG